jgi:nucleoid-associated protein YgaU
MAKITSHLASISPYLQSGSSPGRRFMAVVLCAMLALGSVLPGVAAADEVDSEGEGTAAPLEAPASDFDPGGEETVLEEAPASGDDEEGGPVESEPEADIEVSATGDVISAAPEGMVEEGPSQPVEVPPVSVAGSEAEPVQEKVPQPAASEPVANQSLVAPKREPVERHAAHAQPAPTDAVLPAEPAQEQTPSSPPQPVVATSVDSDRNLRGKDIYVVRPGDCLWHIAAALLPAGADTSEIAAEVERLWRLNEDRIGTDDPNLIYAGTTLRLR